MIKIRQKSKAASAVAPDTEPNTHGRLRSFTIPNVIGLVLLASPSPDTIAVPYRPSLAQALGVARLLRSLKARAEVDVEFDQVLQDMETLSRDLKVTLGDIHNSNETGT